eukprot:360165_1
MEAIQSTLSKVWEKLHESKEISEHIANDFEEFVVEEEFDYTSLIADINDNEDESSIALWLRNNKYNKHNEFKTLQQLITPPSYQHIISNYSNKLEEIKVSYYDSDDSNDDNINNEPQLDCNGIPQKIVIKHIANNNLMDPPGIIQSQLVIYCLLSNLGLGHINERMKELIK